MKKSKIILGDCIKILDKFKDESIQIIITSPPYNIGKDYEKKVALSDYLKWQSDVVEKCAMKLKDEGSIFWQVGNYVNNGVVAPLDILLYPIFDRLKLKLRNRIIWTFGHGLHCSRRFSGRHEAILWFTKSDNYVFNLDPIRIPQKYPEKKYYKGPNKGKYSCNPLGKNPSDVWNITNVKAHHPEKTSHPCQFPEELVRRIILSCSNQGDVVFDPFLGSGTTVVVANKLKRIGVGCDVVKDYVNIARARLAKRRD